jgi:hypothetical protein
MEWNYLGYNAYINADESTFHPLPALCRLLGFRADQLYQEQQSEQGCLDYRDHFSAPLGLDFVFPNREQQKLRLRRQSN